VFLWRRLAKEDHTAYLQYTTVLINEHDQIDRIQPTNGLRSRLCSEERTSPRSSRAPAIALASTHTASQLMYFLIMEVGTVISPMKTDQTTSLTACMTIALHVATSSGVLSSKRPWRAQGYTARNKLYPIQARIQLYGEYVEGIHVSEHVTCSVHGT